MIFMFSRHFFGGFFQIESFLNVSSYFKAQVVFKACPAFLFVFGLVVLNGLVKGLLDVVCPGIGSNPKDEPIGLFCFEVVLEDDP